MGLAALLLISLASAMLLPTPKAAATPLIALREAQNCGACHNPGRSQRPVLERRCTLDCQGCHIDPSGDGPRNQWGYYYSQAELNTLKFYQPQDPLQDDSRFDVHYDGRFIWQATSNEERTFPMSSEFSLRLRPFVDYLHFTYEGILLGRIGDQSFRATRSDQRRFHERYSVMLDKLPLNTYVRAYRGEPMYGLRRSNHTLWIRERLGLDQFATTDAVEIGSTPNVPFMRASYMTGDPNAAPEDRQKGTSFHGGLRGVSFGWHINGSAWQTQSDKATINMHAVGLGASPGPTLFYAERNWRQVEATPAFKKGTLPNLTSQALMLEPSSQISEYTAAFTGLRGVMLGYVHEELHDDAEASLRRNIFLDLHPIPFLQMEVWRRFETGTRRLTDTLGIVHLYFDF